MNYPPLNSKAGQDWAAHRFLILIGILTALAAGCKVFGIFPFASWSWAWVLFPLLSPIYAGVVGVFGLILYSAFHDIVSGLFGIVSQVAWATQMWYQRVIAKNPRFM